MSKTITFQEAQTGALGDVSDGTYPVVLLTPGQGTTAYYSEEVIRRDAPAAFPRGTHVYLDHLQEGQTRTAEKILGTLVEDTTIREDGAAVNRFKPVNRWAPLVEDVHKIAGLSINAAGRAKLGMVDGRSTRIAEAIEYHITNSVDLVSYPGRPGSGFTESYDDLYKQAMDEFEKEVQPEPSESGAMKEGYNEMTDEKLDKLIESVAALTTLIESAAPKAPEAPKANEGADVASLVESIRAVESAEVPTSVKDRLIEGLTAGKIDADGVKAELDGVVALREELKVQLTESAGVLGATGAQSASAPKVNGWGS